jgi:hypothetical protein
MAAIDCDLFGAVLWTLGKGPFFAHLDKAKPRAADGDDHGHGHDDDHSHGYGHDKL